MSDGFTEAMREEPRQSETIIANGSMVKLSPDVTLRDCLFLIRSILDYVHKRLFY